MKAHLTLLATAALLSACGSLVPTREADTTPLRERFQLGEAQPAASPHAPAATEWDGFFTDPRLPKVVAVALAQNRSLRASAALVERARAQAGVAEAARWPAVDGAVGATRQRSAGNTTTSANASLGLARYEIDLFDRLGSLQGAALARYEAQRWTQRAAQLSLVAEVSNAWLTLAAEQQRLRVADALRESQQRTLTLTEKQYALGAVSGLVRARAQTTFEAARGEAARSRTAVAQARLQLELLAGQPLPDDWLPTADAPAPSVSALPTVPAGLPATVLLQRPDVQAAEQQLQAAAFDVGAARAARFPRLSLTGSLGTRSTELDGLFKAGTGFWSLAPQIDIPLFDAGARAAQADVAQATRQQAIANYEATLQAAFREVADALAVRDNLAERLSAATAQVDAAQRSLTLAEASYRLGASSQLELLDAQRQLSSAQQALIGLQQAEQTNRVQLLRALGGRWGGADTSAAPG
jgi:NodT family efflux transporter outer membrane factor (OMF) lipoprotein